MQEEAEASRQDDSDERAILRAKRLLFIARYTSTVCKKWETIAKNEWFNSDIYEDMPIDPYKRARFEQGFYCVWTVGVMARATHLQEQASEFLDTCGPHRLCDLDFGDETWRTGCDLVANRCHSLLEGST
jgi:hypothetical protein